MNAPTKAADLAKPSLQLLALGALVPSKTHVQEMRRARFDKAALQRLADDIKRNGLLQHPLARPAGPNAGAKFEIVAGERRWLAAKLAGLAEIYVNVRELSDEQALEAQLSENLQREDLHELEEAEGYEELMKLKKINADQVAEMIDQSRSYVYSRLKLLALCPEARKAFYAGEIDYSRALLIARIGHHDTQRQAMKDLLHGEHGRGDPMNYREAHRHVLQRYMLALKNAPFDIKDAGLLPKAGACGPCPKRTGNQVDLFGDVKSADVCTDPKCFDDKRQAHYGAAVKLLEAKGKKVISGDEAKKAFPEWDSSHAYSRDDLSNRYAPITGHAWVGHRQVSVREVLGEDYETLLIQHPATGKIVEVATQAAVQAAVQKHNRPGAKASRAASKPSKPKGPDVDDVLTDRLAKLIHQKAPKEFGKAWYVALAGFVRQHLSTRDLDAVALAWGWKGSAFSSGYSRKMPAEAAKLGERDLVLLMFHMVFAIGQYTRGEVLKLFGIKEQEIREQILEERKAARAKKPAAPAAAIAGKKLGTRPTWSGVELKPKALGNRFNFMAPMLPSDQLAVVTGAAPIARTEITKKVWGYIKKHGLQDKKNRRMINADATLQLIFKGKKQLSLFEMTKAVSLHLKQMPGKAKTKGKGKKK